MKKTLYIVRGLPGSGKSTIAETLAPGMVFSADDYFVVDGVYNFDPMKLGKAHEECLLSAASNIVHGSIAVANTFVTFREAKPYFELAKRAGARVVVIDLFDSGMTDEELVANNVHGVPVQSIEKMRARWASNIRPEFEKSRSD